MIRQTEPRRQDDSLFAKYTYNALGWRTSAVWDIESNDGDLDNEVLEEYRYDESWRMVAILRRGVVSSEFRTDGILYQRIVYHNDGLNGYGSARGLDLPLYRERRIHLAFPLLACILLYSTTLDPLFCDGVEEDWCLHA